MKRARPPRPPPSLPCPGTILGLRRLANDNPSVGLSESSGAGQTCLWAGWVGHESSATPGGAGDSCRSLRSGVELMGRIRPKAVSSWRCCRDRSRCVEIPSALRSPGGACVECKLIAPDCHGMQAVGGVVSGAELRPRPRACASSASFMRGEGAMWNEGGVFVTR